MYSSGYSTALLRQPATALLGNNAIQTQQPQQDRFTAAAMSHSLLNFIN